MDFGETLAECSRWLYRLGFSPGTSGNLSIRIGNDRLLVTPTGCSKGLLCVGDMVEVDMEGNKLEGTRNATSEISMHLAIYKMRPDIRAVVHGHPPLATAFACCGLALDQPICSEMLMTLGIVPLAHYATTGTVEVGLGLAPFVSSRDAILLANHGAVSYGSDLQDAMMKMEVVEHFAQISSYVRQIGGAKCLSQSQISELLEAKEHYRRRTGLVNVG